VVIGTLAPIRSLIFNLILSPDCHHTKDVGRRKAILPEALVGADSLMETGKRPFNGVGRSKKTGLFSVNGKNPAATHRIFLQMDFKLQQQLKGWALCSWPATFRESQLKRPCL
jgi:hypothetical protein